MANMNICYGQKSDIFEIGTPIYAYLDKSPPANPQVYL